MNAVCIHINFRCHGRLTYRLSLFYFEGKIEHFQNYDKPRIFCFSCYRRQLRKCFLNIIKAKDQLFRDRGFEITIKKFLYDMYSFICLCECNNDKSDEPPALRYKVFVFF